MADERINIDEFFKEHLNGYTASTPPGAWDRLHASLHPVKKKMPLLYWRLAAAVILLLLAFSAGYFWSDFKNNKESSLFTETSPGVKPVTNPPETIHQEGTENLEPVIRTNQEPDNKYKPQQKTIVRTELAQNQPTSEVTDTGSEKETSVEEMASARLSEKQEEATGNIIDEVQVPVTENITETEADPTIKNQKTVLKESEKLTPEMLHQMLVGNNDLSSGEFLTGNESAGKWSVGGQISPVYSYRNLNGEGFYTPDELVDQSYFNDKENGIVTLAGGISLDYGLNDRISFSSGLYLSRIGQANEDVVAYDSPDSPYLYKLAGSGGTVSINPQKFEKIMLQQIASPKDSIPGEYLVNGTFIQNFDYLEVPLVINYKLLNRRFIINLSGGFSPGILVNNRSYFDVDGEKIQTGYTENINPTIINSLMGVGMEYSVSGNFSVNFKPTFKYALSPINHSNNGLKYTPYSISWFTGLIYKL